MEKKVDWKADGFTPRVRNQGLLPYNAMMAAAMVIEGVYYCQTKELLDLSEQQIIDSVTEIRGSGIKASELMKLLTDYRITSSKNYSSAFCSTGEYKKQAYDLGKVKDPFVLIKEMKKIVPVSKCMDMEAAMIEVLNVHPILGCMTSLPDIKDYNDGVYGSCINHLVVIVGYGQSPETKKKVLAHP